ncbi:DUF3883 domain-containing protein [Metamycoplasma neophronis]|uniref:DUF3883 domain-containing protein n=1 Tax=Metamycoplasma neophronis TaxID=872983 RepID=A0ABY2Z0D1_9BACT|nr:DUF3883 domain-containing protein [Metamycoplasma neophronis]TPR53843.1 DUF3883 domain-containing protein [Metamycoplasma neophronis]
MLNNFYSKLITWIKSKDYEHHVDLWKNKQKELENFKNKFSIEYINIMLIEEYVTGRENKTSFCYMVEEAFDCFGAISGRTTAFHKFVVYWDKRKNKYVFRDKRTKYRKNFGNTIEDIYKNIKKALVDAIHAANINDYKSLEKNPLNPQFKNKIAYLYNSDKQLPIYSEDDLNIILTLFNIPFVPEEGRTIKREKLYKFYIDNEINKLINPYLFMVFLYSWYGYREYLRKDEKPTIETEKISEYSTIDVEIEKSYQTIRTGEGLKNKLIYDPSSEEVKRLTGRKAEEIVYKYLNNHKKDLNIKEIFTWCFDSKRDDGKGYDISYIQNDGLEIFIEVKSTSSNLNNRIYFEMSANEYSVMKAHSNRYYIYFVNDVNNGMTIKKILGKDLYGEEPIKYRYNFESKTKNN